jgi:hypothetical protein
LAGAGTGEEVVDSGLAGAGDGFGADFVSGATTGLGSALGSGFAGGAAAAVAIDFDGVSVALLTGLSDGAVALSVDDFAVGGTVFAEAGVT